MAMLVRSSKMYSVLLKFRAIQSTNPMFLIKRNCSILKNEARAWQRLIINSGFPLQNHILPLLPSLAEYQDINKVHPKRNFSVSTSRMQRNPGQDQDDEDEKEQREKSLLVMKVISAAFFAAFMLIVFGGDNDNPDPNTDNSLVVNSSGNPQNVGWNDFYYNMLMTGEVQHIIIHSGVGRATVFLRPDAIYKGHRVTNNVFRLQIPGVNSQAERGTSEYQNDMKKSENMVEQRIREAENKLGIPPGSGISIAYERKSEGLARAISMIIALAIGGAVLMILRNAGSQFTGSMNPFTKMRRADYTLVDPQLKNKGKGVKFSDVAGLREAKIEVKEFVDYLKNPEKYKTLGAKPPKGALLTGPPGCGKTMLAKAVANEANVPFLSMNGSEFIEMIGGLGASRVRDLFKDARKKSPSIIYIDEIDAIGRKRSGAGGGSGGQGGTGEAEQTLNQLLVEMDGITSSVEGNVIMLASTNRADVLDRALLRPGRFDRHITIDLPTVIERKDILEQHMIGVKLDEKPETYSERLATLTPGFSGADLANLINESALHAARTKKLKVGSNDLEYAIERVIAGPEKKTNVLNPIERRVVAYHESGHAIVGWMLKHTDALLKVTILPRTSQALGFAQYTPVDKKLYSPEELLDRMCMALGGRVAESLTFNRITTGAQNDLEKVTKMANAQIQQFGFNDAVGMVSFEQDGGIRPYSKKLHGVMDRESRLLISKAYLLTEEILKENSDKLSIMAEALLERETLNYDDVEKLLGPPPHGKKHLVSPVDYENELKRQANLGNSDPVQS